MAFERLLMFDCDERSSLYLVERNFLMVGRETPERASSGLATMHSCGMSAEAGRGGMGRATPTEVKSPKWAIHFDESPTPMHEGCELEELHACGWNLHPPLCEIWESQEAWLASYGGGAVG